MNEIMNKEIRMNSVEVCELINQFRELESGKSKLEHSDLMKKIRREIEGLELLGFIGEGNFSESSYVNSQNKEQPCFDRRTWCREKRCGGGPCPENHQWRYTLHASK